MVGMETLSREAVNLARAIEEEVARRFALPPDHGELQCRIKVVQGRAKELLIDGETRRYRLDLKRKAEEGDSHD